jgi:hypothetical protein
MMMAKAMIASIRPIFLFAGFFLAFSAFSGGARAQVCNEDLAVFGKQRNTEIEALNTISKAHDNKLDPIAACPHLRTMKDIEAKMAAYMVKNKANSERTTKIAEQACALAAKAKQMQQNGGGAGIGNLPPPPKLPAGPL